MCCDRALPVGCVVPVLGDKILQADAQALLGQRSMPCAEDASPVLQRVCVAQEPQRICQFENKDWDGHDE